MSFGMMEAMLSFLRRQVGLRNDTNDPAGSLHAKIGNIQTYLDYGVLSRQAVASDALKFSSDGEVVTEGNNYLKSEDQSDYAERNNSVFHSIYKVVV